MSDVAPSASPLPSEEALIEKLPPIDFQQALVLSPGRGQLADALLERSGSAEITAWYLDLHQAELARGALSDAVRVECLPDLPEQSFDLVAFPVLMRGEAELTRDLLQQAHSRLKDGGTLAASVDNPRDKWLREQLEPMFDKVTCIDAPQGRVYLGRKTKPLKKLRNFSAEVVFRDEENLIKLVTRPGVFAHRQLDPGARQLMATMDVEDNQRVLDLGCGSGALSLAASLRASHVSAFAVDSNARAVQCAALGAERNGIEVLQTILNSDGQLGLDDSIDVVLCNPPYYSDFEIAEKMLRTARRALRPGGAALFVNKQPKWYEERMPMQFTDFAIFPSGKYWVACGRKP
ncbi:MAG: methyltransferase [Aureliella sp.]